MPRNNAVRTRGRPFQPGNPGRPKGARNRATLAAEALLDGEAETLARKAISMATDGDPAALRLVFERIMPPRRDRPVIFELPDMQMASDASLGAAALVKAVAAGELTPGEALEIAKLFEIFVRTLEATEFEVRLSSLEKHAERER